MIRVYLLFIIVGMSTSPVWAESFKVLKKRQLTNSRDEKIRNAVLLEVADFVTTRTTKNKDKRSIIFLSKEQYSQSFHFELPRTDEDHDLLRRVFELELEISGKKLVYYSSCHGHLLKSLDSNKTRELCFLIDVEQEKSDVYSTTVDWFLGPEL